MQVFNVRNVQDALPEALRYLSQTGIRRDSRNGPVLVAPEPVTVVYQNPCERVMFWAERDANPFFHLIESLWMLAGRNDVALPARYAKQIAVYSDDNETLHGAYGHRWRNHFGVDQLAWIAEKLQQNPDDRRSVLGFWDPRLDLTRHGKDLPCNIAATLQRNHEGALDLVVFQRSGDAIWGVLGANAVHLSFMQEYVALMIGCPVGTYSQVVSNFHAYVDVFDKLGPIRPDSNNYTPNPYRWGQVSPMRMFNGPVSVADMHIEQLLLASDTSLKGRQILAEPFFGIVWTMLYAHEMWRTETGPSRYTIPLEILSQSNQKNDWIVAGTEWIQRRYDKFKEAL